jgi:4-hydroxy-tetrahydrodipicolinate synthase
MTPLWTALVTPFLKDGAIDWNGLEFLIKRQNDAGNGILLFGSTGEPYSLSFEEKKEIVRLVFSKNLSVPILIGLPAISLKETLHFMDFCSDFDIFGFMLTNPCYSKPGMFGQGLWFLEIFSKSSFKIMLYNVPSRTGASIFHQALRPIRNHPNFWAIKDASGTVESMMSYQKEAPNANIFCGEDALLPCYVPLGAKGLVSVASNIWPIACQKYVLKCLEGKYHGSVWYEVAQSLANVVNPIPVKSLLHYLGLTQTLYVRSPLSNQDLSSFDPLIKANQAVEKWMESQQ